MTGEDLVALTLRVGVTHLAPSTKSEDFPPGVHTRLAAAAIPRQAAGTHLSISVACAKCIHSGRRLPEAGPCRTGRSASQGSSPSMQSRMPWRHCGQCLAFWSGCLPACPGPAPEKGLSLVGLRMVSAEPLVAHMALGSVPAPCPNSPRRPQSANELSTSYLQDGNSS